MSEKRERNDEVAKTNTTNTTKPTKRVRVKKTYTTPELMSILGKVFTISHSYRSPDVVQVIGWTKNSAKPDAKRRYIFVRRVKFNSNDHQHGGDGRIDETDILALTEPTYFWLRMDSFVATLR